MEIIAILIVIAGALFATVKILHKFTDRRENHKLRIDKAKTQILELTGQLLDLDQQLEAKFNKKYLNHLRRVLDEDAYSSLNKKLTFMKMNKDIAETGKIIFQSMTDMDEEKIEKHHDLLLSFAESERQLRKAIFTATQLLSSKRIGSSYLPVDKSLAEDQ